MRKNSARHLTVAALVAALYAVLGYFGNIFGLTFGVIQVRFAEALTVLPFLFPSAGPGLIIGCLITNLLSPYGPVDVIFGTLATAVAAWATAKMPKWYLAALPPIAANVLVLPPMWAWAEIGAINGAFWSACGFHALTFALGEAAACYGLGTLLLRALPRIEGLQPLLRRREEDPERTMPQKKAVRLSAAAMMTALVFAGNYLRITLPLAVGGVTAFTLANILCALSGVLLGPGWGFLAAGLGSALYDLTNPVYAMEAPITFLTKGLYGLAAGLVLHLIFVKLLKRSPDRYGPQAAAAACGAVSYLVIYSVKNFFYNGMFIEGYHSAAQCWAVVIAKLPATLVNGALAVIFAPILGVALRKAMRRAGLAHMIRP